MKKNLITIIITSFINLSLAGQPNDPILCVVQYKLIHVIDTTQRDNPLDEDYTLFLGKKMSKYEDYFTAMYESGTPITNTYTDESGKTQTSKIMGSRNAIFKNTVDNKMTLEAFNFQSFYEVDEQLPDINWKIFKEQKNIKGLKCQKAVGKFKGRVYEAWFCNQLPYRNGPWKLGGLPGLIVEASDTKKEVIFEFKDIKTLNQVINSIKFQKNGIHVSKDQYKKLTDALAKDRAAMKGASTSANAGNIIVTDIPMQPGRYAVKPRTLNNPIEKEN